MNEIPEKIDFEGLGDLDAIQDEFYSGLEDLEKQFHQLVERAENNFDLKHSQLKMIYQKMYRNHSFIVNLHEENLAEVAQQKDAVANERKAWEAEMALVKDKSKFASELVPLDVGGHRMTASLETLCSVEGSALAKMFSGKHDLK